MEVSERFSQLRTNWEYSPAFTGTGFPLLLRPPCDRPALARIRYHGPRMISESGGRRARAGPPPPGNRRNFVRSKPELKVETFSFDADDSYSPVVDSLGDDDDVQFAAWAASAKNDNPEGELLVDEDPLMSLLTTDSSVPNMRKDDDESFSEQEQDGHDVVAFEEEEDDELEDEDEDGDDDDEEIDDSDPIIDELEELDDDMPLSARGISSSGKSPSSMDISIDGIEIDVDDEETDDEDVLQTLVNEPTVGPTGELDAEEFEDPSEAELQSAAELLTGTGLLGLGAREDVEEEEEEEDPLLSTLSSSQKLERATKLSSSSSKGLETLESFAAEEEEDDDIPLGDLEEEKDSAKGLDAYNDRDEEEEAEFALLSKTEGSFGKVWDLNEDNYVTVTQPGQTYAYELDEGEADDQEMATLRRGAQGGWGSGLQNDSANKYTPGSREWIARRSYDLIAQATPREMKLWTKRHAIPPGPINDLYPDMTEPMGQLGKVELTLSVPDSRAEIRGVASPFQTENAEEHEPGRQSGGEGPERRQRPVYGTDAMLGSTSGSDHGNINSSAGQAQSALERAVKFPCSFKFKVEGSGDGLIDSLISDVNRVLNKTLPRSTFVTEPAGRYIRVVFAVEVGEARHVTDLYDAFRHNPLVKFSYG